MDNLNGLVEPGVRREVVDTGCPHQVSTNRVGHSTILDLPKHERPREKLLEKGPMGLKDKELLAILLRTGNAKLNAIELADRILKKYPLKKLLSFSARDFMGVKGVDAGKACAILAAFELAKRAMEVEDNNLPTINSAKDAVAQLQELRDFLLDRRMFILGLLQNPNLLEHDRFTDLLWAVSHLTEELEARKSIAALPATDVEHIKGDMARAYGILTREWLAYMEHLKTNYPYMYSLAVRMNPYKAGASPVVT